MATFQECMVEYRKQLEKGAIQAAYKGLMEYMMAFPPAGIAALPLRLRLAPPNTVPSLAGT